MTKRQKTLPSCWLAYQVVAATFKILNLPKHFFEVPCAAGVATVVGGPFRVLLSRTAFHDGFFSTLRSFRPPHLYEGIVSNLIRSGGAMTLQTGAQTAIRQKFGADTFLGNFGGLMGATAMGTFVASTVETWYIRKTTIGGKSVHGLPRIRFSVPLSTCYFGREFFFSAIVLSDDDFPSYLYWPLLGVGTGVSAAFHKQAVWLANKGINVTHKGSVPDLEADGWKETAMRIARGQYTHPACQPRIENPVLRREFVKNFLFTACGPHTFVFRGLMLWVYGATFRTARKAFRGEPIFWTPGWFKKTETPGSTDNYVANKPPRSQSPG